MRGVPSRGVVLVVILVLTGLVASCSDDTSQPPMDARVADLPDLQQKTDTPPIKPDVPVVTEAKSFVTYNVGLAPGAVPYTTERRPLIIDALKKLEADVVCIQELWTDEDAQALIDGVKTNFPFSFREKTEDTSTPTVRCTDLTAVIALQSCNDTKCKPGGISVFDCVVGPCKAEYDVLSNDCKLCLGANTTDPLPCAFGGAKDFVYGGRNGLALLSRVELKETKYTAMDTVVFKRGVLTAKVGAVQVQCIHAPVNLGMLPYPTAGKYGSWVGENAAAITTLTATASGPCTVLMGDLNMGPATAGLQGELEENFKAYEAAGYLEPWTTPQCTWCKDNALTGGTEDKWIDHVMFKGCTAMTPTYARVLDSPVTFTSDGKSVTSRLSDHYGLTATVK